MESIYISWCLTLVLAACGGEEEAGTDEAVDPVDNEDVGEATTAEDEEP